MGLRDDAKADINEITTDTDGWATDITISKLGTLPAPVILQGLHTKVHLGVDSDGNVVNSKKATATLSEDKIPFTVRNASNEVDLYGYIFEIADSTGVVKKYTTKMWHPDELVGLILIFLDDCE